MGFGRSMGSTPHAMFVVLRHRAWGNGPTVGLSVPQGHQAIEDYRAHRIGTDLGLLTKNLDHSFRHSCRSIAYILVTLLSLGANLTVLWKEENKKH